MRPKVIFTLLIVAGVILVGAISLKKWLTAANPPPAISVESVAAPVPEAPEKVVVNVVPPAPVIPAPVAAPVLEASPEAVAAEIEHLRQAGLSSQPEDLTNILAALTRPEKAIREAAIQAAKQFGSTNAIPALQAAAASTTDPGEQAALQEAADFIALPSFDASSTAPPKTPEEIQAKQQSIAESQATRQLKLQKRLHLSNQNSPATPPAGQ